MMVMGQRTRCLCVLHMLLKNAHVAVSSEVKRLNFDLALHLHLYFEYGSSECSGESAHMRRLA